MPRMTKSCCILNAVVLVDGTLRDVCVGRSKKVDCLVLDTVGMDPQIYMGCIQYGSHADALRRRQLLQSYAIYHGLPVRISERGNVIYIIKAVEFDE